MKRRPIHLLGVGLLLVLGSSVLAQSGGNYVVEWNVIGTAGDQFAAGGSYQVGFTLGQDTPPAFSAGGGYQIIQGYWAGGGIVPTGVSLAAFWIEARGDTLVACWEMASEVDTLGFNLYRSEGASRARSSSSTRV